MDIYSHNYTQICFETGNTYFLGEGVDMDREAAFIWYEDAAKKGHVGAQYCMGLMYRYGQGVPQNLKKAVYWYEKAADQGYAPALHDLASMYRENCDKVLIELEKYEDAAKNIRKKYIIQ